jgi:lipoate-protein ligase A
MAWRLIIDGALSGAHNMARDVAMLEAVSAGNAPPTLRLYGWAPPCLTLGKHQGLDAADLDFCRTNGVDVARRPTGGRALLHHHELTYAVAAPLGVGPIPRKLQDAYRRICGGLVRACRGLGVDAVLIGGEVNLRLPDPTSTVPCFEAPAEGEVVVSGRKLVGSAMRAHAGAILQHGAVLLDWDGRLQAGSMGLVDDSTLRRHVTTLGAEVGRTIGRDEIEGLIVEALAQHLGISFAETALSAAEVEREVELASEFAIQPAEGPTGRAG